MKITVKIIFIILFVNISFLASAQVKDRGIPFIKNYKKKEYKAGTQTWAAVQDDRGIMYFANNSGILEFDGTHWETYNIHNQSVIRSVAKRKNGLIYAGAFNEFGYLPPDERGILQYKSLSDDLPENEKNFGEIWKIIEFSDKIYFQSFSAVFCLENDKIRQIASDRDFHFAHKCCGRIFVQDKKKGLFEMRDDNLVFVEGTGEFTYKKEIWAILPFDENSVLIATQNHGLFILKDNKVKEWDIPVNDLLKKIQIFSALKLKNDSYAFGTIQNGLLIIDKNGSIVQHINKKNGLQNNTILSITADTYNNLWLGLDNGIDYIETNSPFTLYSEGNGIFGTGYSAIVHDNKLYLGTNQGLFYTDYDNSRNEQVGPENFKPVEGTKGQVWNLSVIDNTLLCGHNKGTLLIEEDQSKFLYDKTGCWMFKKIPETDLLLGGSYSSLIIFRKNEKGEWEYSHDVGGFEESCRSLEFDNDGSLWVSHGYKGVYNIFFNEDYTKIKTVTLYNSKNGFPIDIGISACKLMGELFFTCDNFIFIHDKTSGLISKTDRYNLLFGNTIQIKNPVEAADGSIWFYNDDLVTITKKNTAGQWEQFSSDFHKIAGTLISGFENLKLLDDSNVIFGTENGFVHYSKEFKTSKKSEFNVYIREVAIISRKDSIIFGGLHTINKNPLKKQTLNYKCNAIRFRFAANFFEDNEKTLYKTRLTNYEKKWTKWNSSPVREFTNLPSGKYQFEVVARNIYDEECQPAIYSFSIAPPWYQTVAAYIFYLIILAICIYIAVRYIIAKFDEEKLLIEQKQKEELRKKEEVFEKEQLHKEKQIMKLRNDNLRSEIVRRKDEAENKNKELATIAMHIGNKNETLEQLEGKLQQISQKVNPDAKKHILKLVGQIQNDLEHDNDWKDFATYFDEVHDKFLFRLKEQFSDLTPKDLKMCAYLRMNQSTKEIAPLMNISIRGVEVSRYRIRKKLNLSKDTNLNQFMMDF